jgi:pyruvate-formate lyase-activating enzyme
MKLDTKAIEKVVKDRAANLAPPLLNSPSALLDWAVTTTLQQVTAALEKEGDPRPQQWYNLKELTDRMLATIGGMTPAQYLEFSVTTGGTPMKPQLKADEQVWPVAEVERHMDALKQFKLQNNIQ